MVSKVYPTRVGPLGALVLAAWFLIAYPVSAQLISLGPGANLSLGAGTIRIGCGDLVIAGNVSVDTGSFQSIRDVDLAGGSLLGGSGAITLSGDWLNSGSFDPGTGIVSIVDGCATSVSRMTGNSTFYSFNASTGTGRRLEPRAGSTQTFVNSLSLIGSPPDYLVIGTDQSGSQAFFQLDVAVGQTISGGDVRDNNAQGGQTIAQGGQTIAPGPPGDFNSLDSGNIQNWFIRALEYIHPVDILPLPALGLLILLMALFGVHWSRISATERHLR